MISFTGKKSKNILLVLHWYCEVFIAMTSKNSFDQSKFEISNQYLILRKFYRNLQRINTKRFVIMDL